MIRSIKCLLIIAFIPSIHAYPQDQNLEKYWIYRERVKNFVLSYDVQGGGIPANERSRGEWFPSGYFPQKLVYDDAPWMIGYWIGTLAMEYKVLNDNGHDVSQTKKDLFYAIDAINQLDFALEESFGCTPFYNGSILRDNIPQNFPNEIVEGEKVNDLLNGNWSTSKCRRSVFVFI